MREFQARQGDIFFRGVESPPSDKGLSERRDGVLAHGEVTGHRHAIRSPGWDEVLMWQDNEGSIYLYSESEPIQIGHEEHDTITLPAGTWVQVYGQREYDPLAVERERRVLD